jgi:chromosomal replication initiator protein
MDNQGKAESTIGNNAHLIAEFSFDNFVVGSCNELCVAACRGVVAQPGETYNPLFIYGETGTGKTHLAQAVANALIDAGNSNIVYIKGERFVTGLMHHIRIGETKSFLDKYLSADVLIVDEVQFIAGKEQSEEELQNLFDIFYGMKKQVIIISDDAPTRMNALRPELASRFNSGLVTGIQSPDLDTRLAFVSKKSTLAGVTLDDATISLMATWLPDNLRVIEGALIKLTANSYLLEKNIDLPFAKQVLKDQLLDDKNT